MNDDDIIRRLRGTGSDVVLLAAVEQGQLSGDTISTPGGDVYSVTEAADELQSLGLAHVEHSLSDTLVQPNDKGRRLASRIVQSQESGEDRWDSICRAVAAGLLASPTGWDVREVDGRPVTAEEREIVHTRLKRWGCVKVVGAWGGGTARLLPGDRLHEVPTVFGSLAEHFEGRPGGSISQHYDQRAMHISGGQVGAALLGDHGTQNVGGQTFTHDERTQILEVIDGILRDTRDEPGLSALVEEVSGIREAVEAGTARPTLKDRVGSALGTAVTASATQGVLQSLAHLQALIS